MYLPVYVTVSSERCLDLIETYYNINLEPDLVAAAVALPVSLRNSYVLVLEIIIGAIKRLNKLTSFVDITQSPHTLSFQRQNKTIDIDLTFPPQFLINSLSFHFCLFDENYSNPLFSNISVLLQKKSVKIL